MERDRRAEQFLARLCAWAAGRDDVRGAVLFGSRAREAPPADVWSDVDLLVSCTDPDPLLKGEDWLAELGEPKISFLEKNPVDRERERRVLFASGLDVDFSFIEARKLRLLHFSSGRLRALLPRSLRREAGAGARALATIFRPGYRILVDKDGRLGKAIDRALERWPAAHAPSPRRSLQEISSDFWYHAVWCAKKLCRGELWMAKGCCDGYMKERVIEVFSLGRGERPGLIPVRFVDKALEEETAALLKASFASYDPAGVARGLGATMDLFSNLSRDAARRLALELAEGEEEFARAQVAELLSSAATIAGRTR